MEQLEEFENTFLELYDSANILIGQSKNKSAAILLSKAIFALLDYIIFLEYKKICDDHTDRFRILRTKLPALYAIIDKVWNKYRDTYSKPTNEETINLFKEAIREVSKHETVSQRIKEAVK